MKVKPILKLILCMISFLSGACHHSYKYEIPELIDDGWETSHVREVGIDSLKMELLVDQIYSGKYKHIHSLLVVRNGKLAFEEYFEGFDRSTAHDIASVTKSITSSLVGIAIDRGDLESVELPVWKFYESSPYQSLWDSLKRQLRIKDLLTMRHGLDCDDFNTASKGDFEAWKKSEDYIEYMLRVPMKTTVDHSNAYCTGSTQLLEPVLREATGLSIMEFSRKYLFEPLAVTSFEWQKTPDGHAITGMGGKMTPRDMAKFGLLYLNKGNWHGQQLISEEWIKQSWTAYGQLFEGVDYGYLWYIEPPVKVNRHTVTYFDAAGHGGQTIAIYPGLQMVVVITASNYQGESDYYEMLEKYLLPALNDLSG